MSDAVVTARDETSSSTAVGISVRTNKKGSFEIRVAREAPHLVRVEAEGLATETRGGVWPGKFLSVRLVRNAIDIRGKVVTPKGVLVHNARIFVQSEGQRNFRETKSRRGEFELAGLSPGNYSLAAIHEQLGAAFVSVPSKSGAVDVILRPFIPLSGRLVDEEGGAVTGKVSAIEANGSPVPDGLADLLKAVTESDGQFSLRLASGGFRLLASSPDYAEKGIEVDISAKQVEVDVGDVVLNAGLRIEGRVEDTEGRPIPHATLKAVPTGGGSHKVVRSSNSEGAFVLPGLRPGGYYVSVSAPGFVTLSKEGRGGEKDLLYVLSAGGAVTGIVETREGEPINDYQVLLTPESGSGDGPISGAGGGVEGRFHVEDCREGVYLMDIHAPGRGAAQLKGVRVVSGRITDVGHVSLNELFTIRGTVVDGNGGPISGARVAITARGFSWSERPSAVTDLAGRFHVSGIPAGQIEARAIHPAFADAAVSGFEVDPSAGNRDVRIVMTAGGRVEGLVSNRDDRSIRGTQIQLTPLAHGGSPRRLGPYGVQPDGAFAIEHVPPGPVRVERLGMGPDAGVRTVQSKVVHVEENETTFVELSARDILVSGRVTRAGVPLANALVAFLLPGTTPEAPVLSESASDPRRSVDVTAEDGRYEVSVSEAGRFSVSVEDLTTKKELPRRVITIPDVDAYIQDLDFGGASFSGIAVDAMTGAPLSAKLLFRQEQPKVSLTDVNTGPEGRFDVQVDEGDYSVFASADGHRSEVMKVSVRPHQAQEMKIVLRQTRSITGTVVDDAGRPVPNITVSAFPSIPLKSGPVTFTETLSDGSFEFPGVSGTLSNLFASDGYLGFAHSTGIRAGQSVRLELRKGGRVQLEVLGPDGSPLSGAYAILRQVGGVPIAGTLELSVTDTRGVLEVAMPADRLVIEISDGKRTTELNVTVPTAGHVALQARLQESPR